MTKAVLWAVLVLVLIVVEAVITLTLISGAS